MRRARCTHGGVLRCKRNAAFKVTTEYDEFLLCEEHKNYMLYEQGLVKEPSLRVSRL